MDNTKTAQRPNAAALFGMSVPDGVCSSTPPFGTYGLVAPPLFSHGYPSNLVRVSLCHRSNNL